jgi:hypothetical protein
MSRTFIPHIKAILGINSGATIFANLSVAFIYICVGNCPTFGGFSANCIGNMAIWQQIKA